MSFRDVQKLKETPAREAAVRYEDEALLRKLSAAAAQAPPSAREVLSEVQAALQSRTAQIGALRRNYENLHTICEEYHEQLDALRAHVAGKAEAEQEIEKVRQQATGAAATEARARMLETQLREAESQIASAKDQLVAQTSALQESSKATKRLAAALRVAEQRAAEAAQEATTAAAAKEAERKALARLVEAESHIEQMRQQVDELRRRDQAMRAEAERMAEAAVEHAAQKALEQMSRVEAEASARIAALAQANGELEQRVQQHDAEMEQLRAKQASTSNALAADHARVEAELELARESERRAREACASAEAKLEVALAKTADGEAAAREREETARSEAQAHTKKFQEAVVAAEERLRQAEAELAEMRELHAGQAERIVESERARAGLQARVRELETEAAKAPAPARSAMPTLSELQMQALQGELEGWRLVANEAQEAKAKLEDDLRFARRELRALGYAGTALGPEPTATLAGVAAKPSDGPRSRTASRGFLLPRGGAVAGGTT